MNRTTMAIASTLLTATMLLVAAIAGTNMPADVRLPIHWGISGEADGFSDKWTALLIPPAVAAAVSLLFYFLPALEPRREGLERSQGLYFHGWLAVLLIGPVAQLAAVSAGLGWNIPNNHLVAGTLGVVFVIIGNQLGKSRSMYMIGIRTPWTLASEEIWMKTHRLTGRLMVLGGILVFAAAVVPSPAGLLATLLVSVFAAAVAVPVIYSFLLWRKEKAGAGQASG